MMAATFVDKLRTLRNLKGTSKTNQDAIDEALNRLNQHQKELDQKQKELDQKQKECNDKINELDSVKRTLNEKLIELANAKAALELERTEAKKQEEAFKAECANLLETKEKYKSLLDSQTPTYTTEDISDFLNKTIKDFNSNTESDSEVAKYIINNMDVDLKVRVYDDGKDSNGNGSFKFVAPSINETSEDSLSSIKITIQAVPK